MNKKTIAAKLRGLTGPVSALTFYEKINLILREGGLAAAIRLFLCDNEAVFRIGKLQKLESQQVYLTCDGLRKVIGSGCAAWETKQQFKKYGKQVEDSNLDEAILAISRTHCNVYFFFEFLAQFIESK